MDLRQLIRWIPIVLLTSLVIGEAAVRSSGLVDFPIYSVDDEIGYIPKPNQQGCFRNMNCWAFNDRSMGTSSAWDPNLHPNVLLIGNSIVMGGNLYKQQDKLASLVQQKVAPDYSVWSIAAGGWSNVNETVYLERHPEVTKQTTFFVWEYMSGGASQLTSWAQGGEYTWPHERPKWALWYVLRRYVLPRLINFNTHELPPSGPANPVNLAKFRAAIAQISQATGRKQPGILFLYPTKVQLQIARRGEEWLPERQALDSLSHQYRMTLLDISNYPEWTEALYRDGTHPTIEGNRVLADLLAATIIDSLQQDSAH